MTYSDVDPSDDIIGHIDCHLDDGHDGELKRGDFTQQNTEGDEDGGSSGISPHQAQQVEVDVGPGAVAVLPLDIGVL